MGRRHLEQLVQLRNWTLGGTSYPGLYPGMGGVTTDTATFTCSSTPPETNVDVSTSVGSLVLNGTSSQIQVLYGANTTLTVNNSITGGGELQLDYGAQDGQFGYYFTLTLNGAATNTGGVLVYAGATLNGTGSVSGPVTMESATLSGSLTTGNIVVSSSGSPSYLSGATVNGTISIKRCLGSVDQRNVGRIHWRRGRGECNLGDSLWHRHHYAQRLHRQQLHPGRVADD